VTKAATRPTTISNTEQIRSPIPKGKNVTFIGCGTAGCTLEAGIVRTITQALGWNLNVINTDGGPQQIKNAWDQVVRLKPDAVLYTAVETSQISSELKQAKTEGIFMSTCCVTGKPGPDGPDFATALTDYGLKTGDVQAAWVVAQSGGKGQFLYVNLPTYAILTANQTGFKNGLKKYCPSACSVSTIQIPAGATDISSRIVGFLRAHPSVKYVGLTLDDLTIGLPAALNAAGLHDIKIVGNGASNSNLQYIAAGSEAASTAFPYYEAIYAMMDAVVRHATGQPIVQNPSQALWLIDKDNLPSSTTLFPLVANVSQEYFKLWGLGSG
jgi:ribose transport system substrate-binding protein